MSGCQGTPWSEEFDGEELHEVAWWRQQSKAEGIRCFLQSYEKSLINHSARVETQTMSLALGANPEGRERAKGKAGRIQNSRTASALVCLRRNTQHLELKFPESRQIVRNTVVTVFVFTCGPIGCPVSPPLLSSQDKQSHEKFPTSHRARGETQTTSLALGINPGSKERVKGKASRIQSSRIGSALICVCTYNIVS